MQGGVQRFSLWCSPEGTRRRLGSHLLVRAAQRKESFDLVEFTKAVEMRDLGRALQLVEHEERENFASHSLILLNACLHAKDVKLVQKTYELLKNRGLLQNFGRLKNRAVLEPGERFVTPTIMKKISGLEASKVSPKRWELSPTSILSVMVLIALQFVLKQNGVDIRLLLVLVLGLGIADSIYFQGVGLSQLQSLWLPYRRRIMVHEAGHVVVAYLLGCPIRGVTLNALQAVNLGIQGQAGTQFWDSVFEEELLLGRLTSTSLDRYCVVLFAGIAAEALVYGQAEGGETDENMYSSIITGLSPPWSAAKRGNQARWAVLQSFKLLKEYQDVHKAVTDALEEGEPLSTVIRTIEETIAEET